MRARVDQDLTVSAASDGKAPRTARGERTLRKILDAARDEFGERGFAESSIVAITQRAGVALGTFYTYFDSKESVFQALVRDMSSQVRDHVAPALKDATDAALRLAPCL
jgi:AcrR family transcriptional regulator